jgi:hypothetical protein
MYITCTTYNYTRLCCLNLYGRSFVFLWPCM